MRVQLSDEQVEYARQLEGQIEATATLQFTSNYTGLSAAGRYFVGFVGQLGLQTYLTEQGRRFQAHIRTDGQSDAGDVTVWYAGHPLKIDVKTASNPRHRFLMMPEAQLRRSVSDLIVAAKWLPERKQVEFMGVCAGDVFSRQAQTRYPNDGGSPPVRIPTCMLNFGDMPYQLEVLSRFDAQTGATV